MAYVELGEGNGGILLNISEGGLALQSALSLVPEDWPEIRFQLPPRRDWIRSSAKIVWMSKSRKEAGIQFLDLPAQEAAWIREWMEAQKNQAATALPQPEPHLQSNILTPAATDAHRFKLTPYELLADETAANLLPHPLVPVAKPRNSGWYLVLGMLIAIAFFLLGANVGRPQLDQWIDHLWNLVNAHPTQAVPTNTTETLKEASQDDAASSVSDAGAQTQQQPANNDALVETQSGASAPSPEPAQQPESQQPAITKPVPSAPPQSTVATRSADLGSSATDSSWQSTDSIIVSVPEPGSPPFWVNLPPETISASNTIAVNCQRSIHVTPLPASSSSTRAERVLIGKLVSHSDPLYPAEARSKRIEGSVVLHATFGLTGEIANVTASPGPPALATAAIVAIKEWRYEPTFINGDPVETRADITIIFRLP